MLPKYFLAEKLSLISIYTRFLRFPLSFKVNLISRMTGMDPLSLSLACLGAVGTISQLLVPDFLHLEHGLEKGVGDVELILCYYNTSTHMRKEIIYILAVQ